MTGVQTRRQKVAQDPAGTKKDENAEQTGDGEKSENDEYEAAIGDEENTADPAVEQRNAVPFQNWMGEISKMLDMKMAQLKDEMVREMDQRIISTTHQSSSNLPTSGGGPQTQNFAERILRGSPQPPKANLAPPPMNRRNRNRQLPPYPQVQLDEDEQNEDIENGNVAFMLNQTLIQQNMFYSQMARANQATQFAQISATLTNLAGNEGRGRISNFFAHLEAITVDWTSERRALLLSTHLVGTARTLYDGLPEQERKSYEAIKNAVTNSSLGGALAQRSAAQARLMRGLKPKSGQGLREFGIFVLSSVRESLLPETPDKAVEDLAKSYFINGITNFHVKNALTLIHDAANFYELINKAEELDSRMQNTGRVVQNSGFTGDKNGSQTPYQSGRPNYTAHNDQRANQFVPNQRWKNNDVGAYCPQFQQMPPHWASGGNATPVQHRTPGRFRPNNGAQNTNLAAIIDKGALENGDINNEKLPAETQALLGANLTIANQNEHCVSNAKGPTVKMNITIYETELTALLDTGATINVISKEAIEKIKQNHPNLHNSHKPPFSKSQTANGQHMEFLAGIALPIKLLIENPTECWTEFHVANKNIPFPVILGTASLPQLGFQFKNKPLDIDFLATSQQTERPLGNEPSMLTSAGSYTIRPFSCSLIAVQTSAIENGEYLLKNKEGAEAIIKITDNKARIMVKNYDNIPLKLENGHEIGQIEALEKIDQDDTGSESEWKKLNLSVQIECNGEPAKRVKAILEAIRIPSAIMAKEMQQLNKLVHEYQSIFALTDEELGQTGLTEHKITLLDQQPIKMPTRPVPFALRNAVSEMIRDYLKRNVIRPSESPYSSPVVLAKKKDGSLRFCVDFRRLNAVTKKDAYPVPDVDTTLLSMGRKRIFSSLDMLSGYWQIRMEPASIEKTAFATLYGHYEWLVMPFGLTNAPATFERLMERLFDGVLGDYVYVYLDDILIASETWTEHIAHLKEVFKRIRESGLKLKPTKCELIATKIDFLGHTLTNNGLKMNTSKVEAIKKYTAPKNVRELQCFLGLAGYYRKFIKNFALIAKPLYAIMKAGKNFKWDEEYGAAFEKLKKQLAQEVTLEFPDFKAATSDPNRSFVIQTDASITGIGGILGQLDGTGKSRPIYFVSRVCKDHEKRYGITELEGLALYFSVKKFAPFIIGIKTIVETDHSALVQMFQNPKECASARINKWAMDIMSRFDLKISYKPGKSNANADALSRAHIFNLKEIVAGETENEKIETNEKEAWIKGQLKGQYGDLIKYITQKEHPPGLAELQKILEQLNIFSVHEGLLYYTDPQNQKLRLVIPTEFQRELFQERHAGALGTHQSSRKVYEMLRGQFFWPNMRADCERWSKACPVCACCREPRGNTAPLRPFEANGPMDLINIDILQLGLTTAENKYVLVVVDHFTKFLIAEPMSTKSAEEVAQILVNNVFLKYGMAARIHSDKGREFINAIITRICRIMGTKQTNTSGYNPRENGAAERINRDLINMLRKSCVTPQEWDQRLQFAVFSHNISVHSSTRESPFYLMHARDPNIPSIVDKKLLPSKYCTDVAGYKEIVTENMAKIIEKANEELEKAREKYKKYYDANKKVSLNKYKVGQRVMLCDQKMDTTPNKKLNFKFKGPYRIIKIQGNYAIIRSINSPNEKEKTIPTEWLSAVPEECTEFTAEGEEDRAQLIKTYQTIGPPEKNMAVNHMAVNQTTEIIHTLAISLNLQFQMANNLKEKIGEWTSDFKQIYYFSLIDGLGPHARCTAGVGDHAECRTIIASDVLPYAELVDEGVRCLAVPSLAGQLFLRSFEDAANEKLAKAANCLKLDSFTLSNLDESVLMAECQRRLHCCMHVQRRIKECMEGHIPIRCIGEFANLVRTKLSGDVIDHGQRFNDKLGLGWERAYTNAASLIDREPVDGIFHLFVPEGLELTQLGSLGVDVVTRRFPSLTALVRSLRRSLFLGAAQAAILFLPPVDNATTDQLATVLKVMAGNNQIAFFVVPPPPVKSDMYDATITILSNDHGPNVHTNLVSKGRTLFSHGWFGNSPNTFHIKDGSWTRNGLTGIQRFLTECVGLTWAFPAKEISLNQHSTRSRGVNSDRQPSYRGSLWEKGPEPPTKKPANEATEWPKTHLRANGLHSLSPSENRRPRPNSPIVVRVDSTRPPYSGQTTSRRPLIDRVSLRPGTDEKRRRSER